MSAQSSNIDLGRSLTSALKVLQQGPSALAQSSAGQLGAGQPGTGQSDSTQARRAAPGSFQQKLAAALDAGQQGETRPRGSFVNLKV